MKTIKEWLESIPDETIRNQAIKNTGLVQYKGYSSSLSSAIARAFVWSGSPEGHEYSGSLKPWRKQRD